MTIAVALFGEDISPRFDCCPELAFIEEGGDLSVAERHALKGTDGEGRIYKILSRPCDTLLCGGIRKQDRFRLQKAGVQVVDGLMGTACQCVTEFYCRASKTH